MSITVKNLFYGPKIVSDGLVLNYNPYNSSTYTASVGRNYHPNPTDMYAWVTVGLRATLSRDTISSPVGNTPLKMVPTGNDSYTESWFNSNYNISDASIGQTWTLSVYAKASSATQAQLFIFETSGSGGYLIARAKDINVTTTWQRYEYTVTFTNPSTTKITVRLDGADVYNGATIWWDGIQVELSPAATAFTSTYPTNPTYIQDPDFSKKTGTVTSTGFNGLSWDFDGINDNLTLTTYSDTIRDNFSMDVWCMPRATHQIDTETTNATTGVSGQRYLIGPENISAGSGAGISVGTNGISVYEHAPSYMPPLLVYSSTISSSLYSHIVVTYTNKQPRLYLNGVLVRTGLQSLRSFVALGGSFIGYYPSYGYFNGLIGAVKYYNRALTLSEIQQNFNALRGRFGI